MCSFGGSDFHVIIFARVKEVENGPTYIHKGLKMVKNIVQYENFRKVYRTFVNRVKKAERILTSHIYHVNQESQTGRIYNFKNVGTSIL